MVCAMPTMADASDTWRTFVCSVWTSICWCRTDALRIVCQYLMPGAFCITKPIRAKAHWRWPMGHLLACSIPPQSQSQPKPLRPIQLDLLIHLHLLLYLHLLLLYLLLYLLDLVHHHLYLQYHLHLIQYHQYRLLRRMC